MNKRLLCLLPLLVTSLTGCFDSGNTTEFDPFLIGDNMEEISEDEARVVVNTAYNNLIYTSSLKKTSKSTDDYSRFYTGAFTNYRTSKDTTVETEVNYYLDEIATTRNTTSVTKIGSDKVEENSSISEVQWFGVKPVKEGEPQNPNYFLLTKTSTDYNGIKSEQYTPSEQEFSTPELAPIEWNKYVVEKSIDDTYFDEVDVSYSLNMKYIRDNKHIIGYKIETDIVEKKSQIAPQKEDATYIEKTDKLSVIDFYENEISGVGWTIKSVSYKKVVNYLTSMDGKYSDPIEVEKQEKVTSLFYSQTRSESGEAKTFVINDAQPLHISSFTVKEEEDPETEEIIETLEYSTSYQLASNDDYYRLVESNFNGHAYYRELKLKPGYYSFYSGETSTAESYEMWGYNDIKENKCMNYIVDEPFEDHDNLIYITEEATFSFRIVFDSTMETISEFTVAVVSK